VQQLIPAVHFVHRPPEHRGRIAVIGHDLVTQVRQCVEDSARQRLLVSKRIEVRRLVRRLDVPCALVLTFDALITNERFQRRQRGQGNLEQLTRARFAESFDERGRLELESRQYLPAIARAGTPADAFTLEHDDGRAGMGELACGRQARVAGANNRYVERGSRFRGPDPMGPLSDVRQSRIRHRVPPVGVAIQRRYCSMRFGPIPKLVRTSCVDLYPKCWSFCLSKVGLAGKTENASDWYGSL
jgi:hypothetical protein